VDLKDLSIRLEALKTSEENIGRAGQDVGTATSKARKQKQELIYGMTSNSKCFSQQKKQSTG
jgi:hypothetical protein